MRQGRDCDGTTFIAVALTRVLLSVSCKAFAGLATSTELTQVTGIQIGVEPVNQRYVVLREGVEAIGCLSSGLFRHRKVGRPERLKRGRRRGLRCARQGVVSFLLARAAAEYRRCDRQTGH